MRQGQQNRRGRGRNRKGHQNPLTRSFESNGPDVKIRGTPAHIAEKYISLARDAQASGDPVLAENYLQHAEHYNRIIMAFREQHLQQSGDAMNGGNGGLRHRPHQMMDSIDGDDFADEEGDDLLSDAYGQPPMGQEFQPRGNEGQRRFADRPARPNHEQGRPPREPDQMRHAREPDHRRMPRDAEQERAPRERFTEPRNGGSIERDRAPQPAVEMPGPESSAQPSAPRGESPPRRRERFAQTHEQPEFLRRPVRRPRREANGGDAPEANGSAEAGESSTQDKGSA